ncbi:galactokinase [Nocardioides panacis]|uniref:galactokinase n=1 Tax=Nocardioides panacis TaxID=2849501 RepID=UPI0020B3714E|nr:galactokinase [Nocardioides panacis]
MENLDPGQPDAIADRLAAEFTDLHGRAPLGVFTAPGRVNLIGEHVDYNGGLCLPMALPHATYAAVGRREDDTVTLRSKQSADTFAGPLESFGPGRATGWAAYAGGVLWSLAQDGWDVGGLDVVVDSRVPVGAGLSSSAALECAVAIAVAEAAGSTLDDDLRGRLVKACMRAEQDVAGAPTGGMDQTIALFGRAASALLLDCRDWSSRQVTWDPASAGLTLLVVDTRASHSLTDGGYEARRRDCETASGILGVALLRDVTDQAAALESLEDEQVRRRTRHVFTEIDRVEEAVDLLGAGDFEALGRAFTASHVSLRDDYEVSCDELDAVVEVALEHGALGARMTGGGFGGSAIALVPDERVDEVRAAVAATYDGRGWDAPAFLTAPPSPGARRLR